MANMALQLAKVDNPIRVEGFTDTVPIRNSYFPSNWELSASRAGSVVRLFQENGIKPERLVAVGRGSNLPVGDNATADGRASNRRVAITVLASGLSDAKCYRHKTHHWPMAANTPREEHDMSTRFITPRWNSCSSTPAPTATGKTARSAPKSCTSCSTC